MSLVDEPNNRPTSPHVYNQPAIVTRRLVSNSDAKAGLLIMFSDFYLPVEIRQRNQQTGKGH